MNLKTLLSIVGVIALSAALVPMMAGAQGGGGGSVMSCCKPQAQGDTKKPVAVPLVKGGVQKATVTIDGGYSPSSLAVQVGKPVEITFVRKSAAGCDGDIVIPALKYQKSLKPGEKTVVKFTPKKAGSIAFQCGMAMYKGAIIAK